MADGAHHTPALKLDTPAMKLDTPAMKLDTPAMKLDMPPVKLDTPAMKLDTPAPPRPLTIQAQHSAGVMSPVNQNGCFEFDRIIKAGSVLKRTRKTKQWKPIYLVLRPNCLSIYKDKAETKLRHQINLSDITAVARQRDSKKKMDHVFGVFSPARNYHLGASTDREAQDWVDRIRAEARIDEDEGDLVLLSPSGPKTFTGFDRSHRAHGSTLSSSSEAEPSLPTSLATTLPSSLPTQPSSLPSQPSSLPSQPSSLPSQPSSLPSQPSSLPRESISSLHRETQSLAMHSARRPSQALNYSGNEHASVSDFDFSDSAPPNATSTTSLPYAKSNPLPRNRNVSQTSNLNVPPSSSDADPDRVVYHGWLYILKSKGGVRQWKKVWVVLRPRCLAFYKNADEYSAHRIIPFDSIIDAVDIDSVSKSKQYCMQVLSDEKNFRFCAKSENELAKWLGAFKSLLVKRREGEGKRTVQTQVQTQAPPALTTTAATPTLPHTPMSQKRVSIAEPAVMTPLQGMVK